MKHSAKNKSNKKKRKSSFGDEKRASYIGMVARKPAFFKEI
jgi:hypothetical protein